MLLYRHSQRYLPDAAQGGDALTPCFCSESSESIFSCSDRSIPRVMQRNAFLVAWRLVLPAALIFAATSAVFASATPSLCSNSSSVSDGCGSFTCQPGAVAQWSCVVSPCGCTCGGICPAGMASTTVSLCASALSFSHPVLRAHSSQSAHSCSRCVFDCAGSYCPGHNLICACPAGTMNSATRAKSVTWCSQCTLGTFANVTGAAGCDPCDVGFQCPLPGMTTEQPCPLGTTCPSGTITAVPCATGRFNSAINQTFCSLCTAGRFAGVQGLSACLLCGAGYFEGNAGQTACSGGSIRRLHGRLCDCVIV